MPRYFISHHLLLSSIMLSDLAKLAGATNKTWSMWNDFNFHRLIVEAENKPEDSEDRGIIWQEELMTI